MAGREPWLPEEAVRPVSLSAVIIAAAGALALAIGANSGAWLLLQRFPQNFGYLRIEHQWRQLDRLAAPVDWLILGDSQCNQGLDPEAFGQRLGVTALRLCMIANVGVTGDAWLLEEYQERFGPPDAVLILHVYDVWARGAPSPAVLAQIPRPWGFWARMSPSVRLSWKEQVDVLMARYVPLVAERTSLLAILQDPRRLFEAHRTAQSRALAGLAPEVPPLDLRAPMVRSDGAAHLRRVRIAERGISEANRAALDRIRGLAEKGNFDVYLVEGPLWDGLQSDRTFRDYLSSVREELGRLSASSPRLHLIDAREWLPLEVLNGTVDHLIPTAARSFSIDLAEKIRTDGGPARLSPWAWVQPGPLP